MESIGIGRNGYVIQDPDSGILYEFAKSGEYRGITTYVSWYSWEERNVLSFISSDGGRYVEGYLGGRVYRVGMNYSDVREVCRKIRYSNGIYLFRRSSIEGVVYEQSFYAMRPEYEYGWLFSERVLEERIV